MSDVYAILRHIAFTVQIYAEVLPLEQKQSHVTIIATAVGNY